MNIRRSTRRAMFVACSHGDHINQVAANAVLAFAKDFAPHHRIHLGDAWDTRAFRNGAAGTPDEGASIDKDNDAATAFLRHYKPTMLFMGNHEDRLWALRSHPRETVAFAARQCVAMIEALCADLGCHMVQYGGVGEVASFRQFGDTLACHGWMYGEQCTRDHVELTGHPIIHAHDHKAKMQPGRVVGAPMGYSVGTLANIPAMHYAKARRATAAWSGGIVFGEYGEGWSQWQLKLIHASDPQPWIRAE